MRRAKKKQDSQQEKSYAEAAEELEAATGVLGLASDLLALRVGATHRSGLLQRIGQAIGQAATTGHRRKP